MDKMIRIACKGYTDLPYTELHDFQGDLKTLTEENYKRLKAHILDTGFAFAEHAWMNPEDNKWYIIDGHQRVRAIRQMVEHEGYQCPNLPVVPVEARDLAEAKRRVLQGTSQFGRMEGQGLYEFMSVNQISIDEVELKFDLPHIDMEDFKLEYFKEPEQLPPGDPDAIPSQSSNCIINKGDIWTLGAHRLICGDSTVISDVEALMAGERADLVFTDPPYGVDYDGGHADPEVRREKLQNDATTDIYADVMPLIHSFSKDSAALYIWLADTKALDVLKALDTNKYDVRSWIIWNKNMAQFGAIGAQYKRKHEPCFYCFKRGHSPFWDGPTNEVSVWDIARASKNEFHPTQKPPDLAERAITNSCPDGGIVLDLFGGSGSTLIAAENTRRRAYLCEIAPGYAQVILERWSRYTGQDPVRQDGVKLSELLPKPEAPTPDAASPQA